MNPPLPEPAAERLDDGVITHYFTEAQLLAYRDACIEMCATRLMEMNGIADGMHNYFHHAALELRKLK